MRKALFIAALLATAISVCAQRITRSYDNVPLPKALSELNDLQNDYAVSFIYDDLRDFTVTADVRRADAPEAVRQMVGLNNIKVKVVDNTILVECGSVGHRLKGLVVDSDNQPLEFANISLLSLTDTTFITGGVSDANGRFVIPCNIDAALMRITYIGMKTVTRRVAIADIGTVRMQPDQYSLKSVTVKGETPKAKIEGTSLVMDVEHTYMSRMGTAADVLSQVPTVVKNGDNYEVIGKGTPLIYINGRKMQSTRELSELKSDEIKTIEVNHNPGARYDATVSSVITIKTKPAAGEGFSVEVGSWTRQDKGTSNNEWLNLKYRKQGLELFANFLAEPNKEANQKNYYDETITADTLWDIHNEERINERSNYYSGKLGFNYNTDKHSFGDKLHVQLDCNDILGTYFSDAKLLSNNFIFRRHDNYYSRNVSLTLRYRFNFTNSKYKGTGAGNDAKQRL